ncbi:hypothetical protein [Frigoriglobus tundricola]|uniref:Permeases of the major facilitator superfamily n=1 Tax=Frigoriglobus tundricola TaxID=2774151 RepID=A0A6M5YTY0_9BACT|nr:hypothetical protein [Frigoriglobus tundricola]QJW97498.1 Permeases of the major facilitator superfamily [Frigoriglobus tundricola]
MTRADRDHLRTLAICHYVLGGLCFFFGGCAIIYLVIGLAIVADAPAPPGGNAPPPPEFLGWVFVGIAAFVLVFYWGLAAGLVLAGRCLDRRQGRTFCLVVAGFSCLFQPLGLVLGVFTFVVLQRPSVRDAFEPVREERPEPDAYDPD